MNISHSFSHTFNYYIVHIQVNDPYDADLETDGGATTTSDMDYQTGEVPSSVLSPSRKGNNAEMKGNHTSDIVLEISGY